MIRDLKITAETIYRHRELIANLVGKELKSRYRGSALGMLWTFLNPLLLLLVYALVFSVYMRVDMENYAVYMFTGLLPWIWFASSLNEGVNAVVASGDLLTKSMFPAEVLPMVRVIANLANYIFSLPLLFLFMLIYGVPFTPAILLAPVVMGAQLIFTIGLVYFFAAVNVRYRDMQHILGNFVTLWFFLCPIIYPVTQAPEQWRFTFYLNPAAVITMGYHDVFLYGKAPDFLMIGIVAAAGMGITLVGVWLFERLKDTFAEEI
jgi:ABC-type polysaccharide/polyol phosphate export permease